MRGMAVPIILGIVVFSAVAVWLGALIAAARAGRPLWFLVILVLPILGTLLWFSSGAARDARPA